MCEGRMERLRSQTRSDVGRGECGGVPYGVRRTKLVSSLGLAGPGSVDGALASFCALTLHVCVCTCARHTLSRAALKMVAAGVCEGGRISGRACICSPFLSFPTLAATAISNMSSQRLRPPGPLERGSNLTPFTSRSSCPPALRVGYLGSRPESLSPGLGPQCPALISNFGRRAHQYRGAGTNCAC